MRALVRFFLLVLVLMGTLLGSAAAKRHGPPVLRPKWHLVPGGNRLFDVLATGRYLYYGRSGGAGRAFGSGFLIDELTGKRVGVTVPADCFLDVENAAPLGGSWMVATCNAGQPPYELYNIPAGTWTPFTPALPPTECQGGVCVPWGYAAIGDDWIEFASPGCFHCYGTIWAFQNLQTGQTAGPPPGWTPGGTEMPDLSSPTLTQALCPPLTVPVGFTNPVSGQTSPGTLSFYGPFALGPGFLERCGSRLRRPVGAGYAIAANAHAVIWETGNKCTVFGCYPHSTLDGLFLPTLRRFRLTMPSTASLVAMSAKHIYAETPNAACECGNLYVAPAPGT